MTFLLTRRNQPRIVELRGFTLPRPGRNGRHQQLLSFRPECACGWTGNRVSSETDARREAMTHACQVLP